MAQGYYLSQRHHLQAGFDYFYRKNPFNGGFVVFAGLSDLLEAIQHFRFSEDDCKFLVTSGFDKKFVDSLQNFKFHGNVYSVNEGEIIADIRGYTATVHGRQGTSLRKPDELEITSMRAGGVPGIHDLIVAGPYEMIRIEHTAFSRNVLAQGVVYAAEWLAKQEKPGIYSMATVLGL